MSQPITDAIAWLKQKLRQSKTQYKPWGRQIIDAIDTDDCCVISEIFSPMKYRFKRPKKMDKNGNLKEDKEEKPRDINCQVKHNDGYDGHVWTPWIHNFTGDTALHMSIKQKKINCTCMLLILDARYDIKNYKGLTSADLCLHVYGCTIEVFKKEAFRTLLKSMPPDKIDLIPIRIPFKLNSRIMDVSKEATSLMWEGRSVFTALPKSVGFSNIKPGGPRLWQQRIDYLSRKPYMINIFTGLTRRLNDEEYKIYCQDFERLEIVDVARLEYEEKIKATNIENMRKIKEKHEQNRINRENLYKINTQAKLLEDEKKKNNLKKQQEEEKKIKEEEDDRERIKELDSSDKKKVDEDFDVTSKKEENVNTNLVIDEKINSNDGNKNNDEIKLNDDNGENNEENKEKIKEETKEKKEDRRKKKRDDKIQEEKNKNIIKVEPKKVLTFKEMEEEKKLAAEKLHKIEVERIRLEYLEIAEEKERQEEAERVRLATRKFLYVHKITGQKLSECPIYFEDDEADGYEELIKLRNIENENKLNQFNKNAKLRADRDYEIATGISLNPGAKGAGDVWGNGTITDIVRTIKSQNLRFRKMEQLDALRKSGLSLLTEAKIGMEEVQFGVPMDTSLSDKIIDSLPQLQGLKKLKFTRIRNLRNYNSEIDMEKEEIDYPIRLITKLSTRSNMKYMNIGDPGLSSLNNVLTKNKTIHTICLTGARVTSESVCLLAANLHQILSLTYLDLSNNSICDKGCIALAIALCPSMKSLIEAKKKVQYVKSNAILSGIKIIDKVNSIEENSNEQLEKIPGKKRAGIAIISKMLPPLKTLSLMGNRISHNGADIIVETTYNKECKLSYLSVARNKLSEDEVDSLIIKSNKMKKNLVKLLYVEKMKEIQNKKIRNKKQPISLVESSNNSSNKSIAHFDDDDSNYDNDENYGDISLIASQKELNSASRVSSFLDKTSINDANITSMDGYKDVII